MFCCNGVSFHGPEWKRLLAAVLPVMWQMLHLEACCFGGASPVILRSSSSAHDERAALDDAQVRGPVLVGRGPAAARHRLLRTGLPLQGAGAQVLSQLVVGRRADEQQLQLVLADGQLAILLLAHLDALAGVAELQEELRDLAAGLALVRAALAELVGDLGLQFGDRGAQLGLGGGDARGVRGRKRGCRGLVARAGTRACREELGKSVSDWVRSLRNVPRGGAVRSREKWRNHNHESQRRTPSARPGTTRQPEGSPGPGLPRMCEAALVMCVKMRAL